MEPRGARAVRERIPGRSSRFEPLNRSPRAGNPAYTVWPGALTGRPEAREVHGEGLVVVTELLTLDQYVGRGCAGVPDSGRAEGRPSKVDDFHLHDVARLLGLPQFPAVSLSSAPQWFPEVPEGPRSSAYFAATSWRTAHSHPAREAM